VVVAVVVVAAAVIIIIIILKEQSTQSNVSQVWPCSAHSTYIKASNQMRVQVG
jgi:hypothetical protein